MVDVVRLRAPQARRVELAVAAVREAGGDVKFADLVREAVDEGLPLVLARLGVDIAALTTVATTQKPALVKQTIAVALAEGPPAPAEVPHPLAAAALAEADILEARARVLRRLVAELAALPQAARAAG